MKKDKIIYWIATGLFCLLLFAGALMYLFNYPMVEAAFVNLGFPTWIIYPLAFLKILGIIAILTKKSTFLKELAYAGFLYDLLLAFVAHIKINDGEYAASFVAIILLAISWIYDRKVFGSYEQNKTAH